MLVLQSAPRTASDSVGYNANKIDLEALKADNNNKKKKKSSDEKCNHAIPVMAPGRNLPPLPEPLINPWGNKLAGFIVLF